MHRKREYHVIDSAANLVWSNPIYLAQVIADYWISTTERRQQQQKRDSNEIKRSRSGREKNESILKHSDKCVRFNLNPSSSFFPPGSLGFLDKIPKILQLQPSYRLIGNMKRKTLVFSVHFACCCFVVSFRMLFRIRAEKLYGYKSWADFDWISRYIRI